MTGQDTTHSAPAPAAAWAVLEPLSGRERGFVLGALIAADPAGENDCLECLAGAWQVRCAEALATVQRTDRQVRLEVTRRLTQQLTQQLTVPLPEGIDRVHPSWISALLARLPQPAVAAAVQALPERLQQQLSMSGTPTEVTATVGQRLAADVLSALQPMMPPAPTIDPEGRDLLTLSDQALVPLIERVACLALAAVAQRAGAAHQRQLEKAFDPAQAQLLRQASAHPLAVQRDHLTLFAQAWQRADRGADESAGSDPRPARGGPHHAGASPGGAAALLNLGGAVAARALSPGVAMTLAQRLPREHGLRIAEATEFGPDAQLLDLLRAARGWIAGGAPVDVPQERI